MFKCTICGKDFKTRQALFGHKKKHTSNAPMNKTTVEKLSKRNAKEIIQGTDKLKSWGKTGWFKSKKQGKWYHYRSSIELNVLKEIDKSEKVIMYETECFAIPYNFKGATLNYIPDIILKTNKDKVYVIEVKPSNQLTEEKNLAKWDRAKSWCHSKQAKFFVITEKDFDKIDEILDNLHDNNITKANSLLEWKLKQYNKGE
jgi:hypothetical protein